MQEVKVCGADWCGDTRRALRLLDGRGVAYDYCNVDNDPQAAAWVLEQHGGKRKLPTIQVGEQILSVPSDADLDAALRANGAS